MIAAGAGGGIAATFNTPIGGVLFAAELLLHEVSVWTLVPVVISTATATYIGRLLLGANPSFVIPAFETHYFHPTNPLVLLSYVGLGVLMGLVSTIFIRSIYAFEDFFDEKVPGNYYTRHVSGMASVGLLIYLMHSYSGHYYIEGVGYATVQDVLSGALVSLSLMLLLFALKVVCTSLTLGSGGSGGVFSPSLFIGATFGGAYGVLLNRAFPSLPISPPAFAVVGMAGMVGGATGAAITAIVMIFEMTLDYNVVLPMTITVAISYGVRKFLCKESVYTLKLARRGRYMPEALQANFHLVRLARDVMDKELTILPASTSLTEFGRLLSNRNHSRFVLVEDRRKLLGVVAVDRAAEVLAVHANGARVGEIAIKDYEVVTERTTVFELLSKLRSRPVGLFLVAAQDGALSAADIKGVISKERIADTMTESLGLLSG
jgi:CIC family chloride channel protein